jgi:hypothetical protein
MAVNLNAIFNLAGTRLYTLVAYLGFCSVSGKSPREFLKSTTEVHNVLLKLRGLLQLGASCHRSDS